MIDAGKLLIIVGALCVLIGLIVWGLGRLGFGGLPGDVRYQSEHVRFYFPIVTCIFLSILLSVLLWLWRWLRER